MALVDYSGNIMKAYQTRFDPNYWFLETHSKT